MQVLPAVTFGCPTLVPGGDPTTCCSLWDLLPMGKKLAFKAIPCIPSWVVQVGVKRSVLHITSKLYFC